MPPPQLKREGISSFLSHSLRHKAPNTNQSTSFLKATMINKVFLNVANKRNIYGFRLIPKNVRFIVFQFLVNRNVLIENTVYNFVPACKLLSLLKPTIVNIRLPYNIELDSSYFPFLLQHIEGAIRIQTIDITQKTARIINNCLPQVNQLDCPAPLLTKIDQLDGKVLNALFINYVGENDRLNEVLRHKTKKLFIPFQYGSVFNNNDNFDDNDLMVNPTETCHLLHMQSISDILTIAPRILKTCTQLKDLCIEVSDSDFYEIHQANYESYFIQTALHHFRVFIELNGLIEKMSHSSRLKASVKSTNYGWLKKVPLDWEDELKNHEEFAGTKIYKKIESKNWIYVKLCLEKQIGSKKSTLQFLFSYFSSNPESQVMTNNLVV